MLDASKYTITVRKGIFDDEECFEARIAEFPDICEYGNSFDEAYNLAIDSVVKLSFCLIFLSLKIGAIAYKLF